jgi:hypothetical protein
MWNFQESGLLAQVYIVPLDRNRRRQAGVQEEEVALSRFGFYPNCHRSANCPGSEIELSPDETDELNRWIKSGKIEQRKVERAKIVLRSGEGKPTHQIAKELGTRPTRVSKWRKRFAQLRLPGLEDESRSGRRVINDESAECRILDQLAKAPPPTLFAALETATGLVKANAGLAF